MPYIFIDSSKRIAKNSTNSNNIHILFNNKVIIKEYIKLINATIPKTIYLINENNNTFKIIFNDNNIINVIIPINNYDTNTLAATIKTLINYWNFNIVFDDTKFIYTLSANQNFSLEFTSEIYKIFGMNNSIYVSNNNILNTNTVNFNNPLYINIDITNIESSFISAWNLNTNFIIPFITERYGIYSYYSNNTYEQINKVSKEYE